MKNKSIMKNLSVLLLAIFCASACQSQDRNSTTTKPSLKQNQPKESWNVNKKLDDKGNVIAYDSTYTWTYSNINGEEVSVDADSVMQQFRTFFDQEFPSFWGNDMGRPFWSDTLMRPGFFQDDYFDQLWKNDLFRMEEMFKQMDSMRMDYFDRTYPGLMTPPKPDQEDASKNSKI